MVKVFKVRNPFCRSLNIRDLLPLILPSTHPDSSRQRKARQRAKDRRVARRLKQRYVPLYFVDPTVYIERFDVHSVRRVA